MDTQEKLKKTYMRVNCNECSHQTIVFTHAKMEVECSAEDCNEIIVSPMGGKADVLGEFAGYVE